MIINERKEQQLTTTNNKRKSVVLLIGRKKTHVHNTNTHTQLSNLFGVLSTTVSQIPKKGTSVHFDITTNTNNTHTHTTIPFFFIKEGTETLLFVDTDSSALSPSEYTSEDKKKKTKAFGEPHSIFILFLFFFGCGVCVTTIFRSRH